MTPTQFLVITAISLPILEHVGCSTIDEVRFDVTTPCQNVAEAINRLYSVYSADCMSLEARCERYAVFLTMAQVRDVTNELALLQMSGLKEDTLDLLYEEISTAELAARYKSAIEVYRSSHLQPAFIDLVECMRRIDTVAVRNYLGDPELAVVVNLYERALITSESIDLSSFDPSIRATLSKLFAKHLDSSENNPVRSSDQINLFNQLSPSFLPQKAKAEQYIRDTEERLRLKCKERRRQHSFRKKNLERVREKDRIRKKQHRERLRLQKQSIDDILDRHNWREPIESIRDRPEKKLERARYQNRQRQRRFRERHAQRLQAEQRERRLRWKQLQDAIVRAAQGAIAPESILQPAPPVDQQENLQPEYISPLLASNETQPISEPNAHLLSEADQPVEPSGLQTAEQTSERRQWLGVLQEVERRKKLRLERQRRYRERNGQQLRARERERKRQLRRKLKQQQQQIYADEVPGQTSPDVRGGSKSPNEGELD